MSYQIFILVECTVYFYSQGGLISLCSDDTIYHWSFASKRPELVNSIQFNRER